MNLSSQLPRFLPHAAFAAIVLWILLGPARPWLRRLIERVGAMSGGRILVVAIGLTLATRLAAMPLIHPNYDADVREYCEKAAAIARDGNPRAQETRPDGTRFYRTLGYSLPLAGWYRVTAMPQTPEGRIRSAQAFNLLAACGVAAMLLALGRAIGRQTAGRVAALAYATFLPAAAFCLIPYTETWTTFLVVASVLAFEKTRRAQAPKSLGFAAAFGLVQGLLVITRTEFAWMPFVAAAWLVAELRWRALAPVAVGLALCVVPLCVNHEMRDGYPGHLRTSVQGGLILYYGNNPIAVNGYGNATPVVVAHVRGLYERDPTGELARDEAVRWIETHPFRAIANAPKKLYHLWLGEPQGFTWQVQATGANRLPVDALRHVAWVEALVLLGLGFAGLARSGAGFGFWIAVLALHAATWCVLAASTRNRYPLEPLLMIAAAAWIETRGSRDASS